MTKGDMHKSRMGIASHAIVASCLPQSHSVGVSILKSGGNSVDAFVATTFADYVVAPGTTSMAGALYAMIYEPKIKKIINLSAGFKSPISLIGLWRNKKDAIGKTILIPGAIAGLFELHTKYGRLAWRKLLDPAIQLAENGFVLSDTYAAILKYRCAILLQSEYSRNLFFCGNRILKAGETLKQPMLATTLKGIQQEGANYLYQGKWAKNFIDTVNQLGGKLILNDLANYKPHWNEPLQSTYRGYEIFAPGGRSYGGIKLTFAMKILERFKIRELGHWSKNVNSLELMIRIARLIESEYWLFDYNNLDNREFISQQLSSENITRLCDKKLWEGKYKEPYSTPSHSTQTIIVDAEGGMVSGMHTISSYPWGDAIFVGGIPLNNFAPLAIRTGANQYIPDASTFAFVKKDKNIILLDGFFASSMFPADYQVLSNILDFEMDPEQALSTPRFGTFWFDIAGDPSSAANSWDVTKNMLDKRYSSTLINELKARGINVTTKGYIDTGMGVVVDRDPHSGLMRGITPEESNGVVTGF